jgi:hypothetical protein
MKNALIFFSLLLCFSFKHPFYLSVTDLKYSSLSNSTLQGTVRLTLNDLEEALSKNTKQTVDLITIKDSAQTKKLLQAYLKSHLKIKLDNSFVEYVFLGFEKEQDAIWLYLEVSKCNKPKKVSIENALLYDYIHEQTNIVHFDLNGRIKSSKVKYPDKFVDFDFPG